MKSTERWKNKHERKRKERNKEFNGNQWVPVSRTLYMKVWAEKSMFNYLIFKVFENTVSLMVASPLEIPGEICFRTTISMEIWEVSVRSLFNWET